MIPAADFEFISKLVRERSAIVLEPSKEYLVTSRLDPLVRDNGLKSITELVQRMRQEPYGGLHYKVVEAMTTNETSFFRDVHPFEALRKHVLPEFQKSRSSKKELTIWCAASSSGQEPYTVAMILLENFPDLVKWNLRILGTDISREMIARAREGRFSQLEVNRGLPASYLVKYFAQKGLEWQLREDVRRLVEYRELNLSDSWPVMPPCDIVMIRNVLIYFDLPDKAAILGKIRRLMKPDSYLFLGGAETTINIDDGYERMTVEKTSLYRLKGAPKA